MCVTALPGADLGAFCGAHRGGIRCRAFRRDLVGSAALARCNSVFRVPALPGLPTRRESPALRRPGLPTTDHRQPAYQLTRPESPNRRFGRRQRARECTHLPRGARSAERAHLPLKRAGRRRGLDAEAARIQAVLRAPQLRQLRMVENAFGRQALALLRLVDAACTNAEELAAEATAHFNQHPDAEIITGLPGLGSLTGARVLAEIGDDRSRFTDARALKAYAGAAPVTRASGKSLTVMHRRVKNQRLASVGYLWAFAALTASPGARAHYDRRKAAGDRHIAAQRNLFNRMIGILHHCLTTRRKYDEHTAFPAPQSPRATSAPAAA
jgi:hypothetical protein